jgi:dihydrofolate reductase
VNGLDNALAAAREAAGTKDVSIMGGADVIRQGLAAGYIEELTITIAPLLLCAGKRLFEGCRTPVELQQVDALQSSFVTHLTYRVVR